MRRLNVRTRSFIFFLSAMLSCGAPQPEGQVTEECADYATMKLNEDGLCECKNPDHMLSPDRTRCGLPGEWGTGLSVSAAEIASSGDMTCIRTTAGVVFCWGEWRARPTQVSLPAPAVAIGVGAEHACAVVDDGEVLCWGSDASGQLGDGGPDLTVEEPRYPAWQLPPARGVCGGDEFSCAVTSNGAVYCWGANSEGQLGVDGPSSTIPVNLAFGAVDSVVCGSAHACALSDGAVGCWGRNTDGQLGLGHASDEEPVFAVKGLPGAAEALCAGAGHSCALIDGQVWCWGDDLYGQLGDGGDDDPPTGTPVLVYGLTEPALDVSCGDYHTCALLADAVVACWGEGHEGALGNGTKDDLAWPSRPIDGRAFTDLACGAEHSCGISDGDVYCWGKGDAGQLGNSTTCGSLVPVPVAREESGPCHCDSPASLSCCDGCYGMNEGFRCEIDVLAHIGVCEAGYCGSEKGAVLRCD